MTFLLRIAKLVVLTGGAALAARASERLWNRRSGYRWRKAVWLILAIWLLVPVLPQDLNGALPTLRLTVRLPQAAVTQQAAPLAPASPNGGARTAEISRAALSADAEASQAAAPPDTEAFQADVPPSAEIPQADAPRNTAAAQRRETAFTLTPAQALGALWIAGAAALMILRVFQYRSVKKQLFASSKPCGDERVREQMRRIGAEVGVKRELPVRVFEQNGASPMILGYARTTLFLPPRACAPDALGPVLRHELTHYRLKDLWYKLLISMVCDLYWFHPLLRLMKRMAFRDVEYVCDEQATRSMDLDARKSYGGAILNTINTMGRQRTMAFTTQFSQSGKQVKRRLENIFSRHSRGAGTALLLAAVLALGLGSAVTVSRGEEITEEPIELRIGAGVIEDEGTLEALQKLYPDASISVETEDEADARQATISLVGSEDAWTLARQGRAADLTDALKARGWEMNDAMLAAVSDENGRVLGIPCPPSYVFGLVANTDIFRQAGLTDEAGAPLLPATWEELAQTAAKIRETTGLAGLCLMTDDVLGAMQFWNIAWCFGAEPLCAVSEDGSRQARLDSAEAIEAMSFIKSLKWDYDVLTDDPTKENFLTAYERLARGEVAMVIGASDALSFPVSYGLDADSVAFGALPAGPSGERHSFYAGSVFVISPDAAPEKIDAALTLVELLGYGPALNEASESRVREAVELQREQGAPVIGQIPVWHSDALSAFEQTLLEEAGAADFTGFFDAVLTPDNLTLESVPYRSELCLTLCDVLHQVVTDENADVEALMKKANELWQAVLDS